MVVYGYTKICSEGGYNGKESNTVVVLSEKERNDEMWKDYSDTFDNLRQNNVIGKEDNNGNPKKSKKEFMKALAESECPENDIFGLIQCFYFHIQFEPFSQNL